MAVRTDVSIDQTKSPRIAEITSTSGEMTVQDSHDTLVRLEDDPWNKTYAKLVSTAGKEDLGGGVTVGLTTTLNDVQYAPQRTASRSSGTATTGSSTQLIDNLADFVTDGVQRGDWVINFTDQSVTEVIEVVDLNTLTVRALTDGTDNDFDIGDAYKVWEVSEFALTGGNFVAIDSSEVNINPLFTTFGRFVTKAAASSATQVETGVSGLTAAESAKLTDIHDEAIGKWVVDPAAKTLTLYRAGGTVLKTFNLTDTAQTVPAFIERIPV